MRESPIYILESDAARLRGLLAARTGERHERDHEHLHELATELERAFLVRGDAAESDVVMLNSAVEVRDLLSGLRSRLTVVFPSEADPAAGRVSVLAPLGCALLGYREGDVVDWEMPGGRRTLRIERVSGAASRLAGPERSPTEPRHGSELHS